MQSKKDNAFEKAENIANGVDMMTPNSSDNPVNSTALISKEKANDLREQKAQEKSSLKERKRAVKKRLKEHVRLKKEQRKTQNQNLKHQRKVQKARDKQKNKERRHGQGGWLVAVISLSVSTLVLACVLTATYLLPTEADTNLEAGYRRAFLDTVTEVNNMDVNLSKILASNDKEAVSLYLVDLAINAELAEKDLSELPLEDVSKFYTSKLINQIGDYAKGLNKRLTYGEQLTARDNEILSNLYQNNLTLKNGLQNILDNMEKDYSFSSLTEGKKGDVVVETLNQIENLSVTYPELIYDGPFSDGRLNAEIKGIYGTEINQTEAKDIFIKHFSEYNPQDVKTLGVSEGIIPCFNVSAMINGEMAYAEITKQGGHLLMYCFEGSCNEVKYQEDFAIEKAKEFLDGLGIVNMKAVWQNLSNNVYTINFAYEQDGIIYYPDLVKVRVCAETNMVIGVESMGYYTNHTERSVSKNGISQLTAQSKIKSDIDVETSRLCVIPFGNNGEILCYEFSGVYEGNTYYVYIEAQQGRQVEMFKVVKSTEGTLLM